MKKALMGLAVLPFLAGGASPANRSTISRWTGSLPDLTLSPMPRRRFGRRGGIILTTTATVAQVVISRSATLGEFRRSCGSRFPERSHRA